MTSTAYEIEENNRRSSRGLWFWIPVMGFLILGGVFSFFAYQQNDVTIYEAVAAGYAGVGALVVGLFAGLVGLVIGLAGAVIGTVIGIVATGGALVVTAFLVGSPIIAIILFVMLMRRDKSCPDPSVHG